MSFNEEDAINLMENLLNYNDILKIKKILQDINPDIFSNDDVRKKFKEILIDNYNIDNIDYLKNKLNELVNEYNKFKGSYHLWFCSEQFRNKFKRKDFRNPFELKKFRDIILRIIQLKKNYSSETIGEFFISPRGHEKYRIAWFIKENAIYLCEQFYHNNEYDEFCERARFKIIGRNNYSGWNYAETFEPLHLKAA